MQKYYFLTFFKYLFVQIGVAMNKLPASAASLDGFAGRDQVGCYQWRSLPECQIERTKTQGSAQATARLAGNGLGALPWVLVSLV